MAGSDKYDYKASHVTHYTFGLHLLSIAFTGLRYTNSPVQNYITKPKRLKHLAYSLSAA